MYRLPTPLEQAQRFYTQREYKRAKLKSLWHEAMAGTLEAHLGPKTLWRHTYDIAWRAIFDAIQRQPWKKNLDKL